MSVAITLDNLLIPRLTTVQRDAITGVNGMRIYNTTDDQFEWFEGGAWTANVSGVSDHGGLTGLTDDDHTQYALLLGRAGGQSLIGGTGASDDLVLRASSNAIEGQVIAEDETDAVSSEILRLRSVRATRADGDAIFQSFYQPDDAGTQVELGRITSILNDTSAGATDGALTFSIDVEGTLTEIFRINSPLGSGAAEFVFNEGSGDNLDFRVEGATETHMIYVDGNLDAIGLGGFGTSGVLVTIEDDTNEVSAEILRIKSTRITRADNDNIFISFYQPNSAGAVTEFGRISSFISDVTSGATEDGFFRFEAAAGGGLQTVFQIGFNSAGAFQWGVRNSLAVQKTYSVTNVIADRTYDANATTLNELADVLGTLIADLRTHGVVL